MTTLFIISNLFILTWTILYIVNIQKKTISLNLGSRIIWIFLEIIDVVSYLNIIDENIKWLMAITSMVWMITIVILAFKKSRFTKITWFDKILLWLGIITIIIWLISKSYIVTNLLLQIAFIIWYIPTISWIYKKEIKEKILPRTSTAFGLIISIFWLSIYYDWRFTLVYPIGWLLGNIWIIVTILIIKNKFKI